MTLDETIKHAEEVAEENQRVVDTGIVYEDITIDMLFCDDTEVIDEHLANYKKRADEYRQIAEWLKELKQLRKQTTWMPVSKKLPEKEELYLVSVKNDHERRYSKTCQYMGRNHWFARQDVEAWMPLPTPYEPQESNDKCKNCEYYRNPDYTRCHECKAERSDKE